jgi:hypothetical protein
VGSYRILVHISDTILSLCSTFLCFDCCIISSDWVAGLTAESHIKPRLYSCDTSSLYRSFRCTYMLHWHLLLCTKIRAVNKMFQASLLCIVFNSGCFYIYSVCDFVYVCAFLCLCVCLYVHVCVCMQVCTYSAILHWIKLFCRWYFIVITFFKNNFRKYTIRNFILEEKESIL